MRRRRPRAGLGALALALACNLACNLGCGAAVTIHGGPGGVHRRLRPESMLVGLAPLVAGVPEAEAALAEARAARSTAGGWDLAAGLAGLLAGGGLTTGLMVGGDALPPTAAAAGVLAAIAAGCALIGRAVAPGPEDWRRVLARYAEAVPEAPLSSPELGVIGGPRVGTSSVTARAAAQAQTGSRAEAARSGSE